MRYIIGLMAVALLTAPALAQDPGTFGPRQGVWELTLSGTGSNDRRFDGGQFGVNAELGHYLNRALSVGVRQDLNWFGGTGRSDTWNAATRGLVHFHFDIGQLRPFVGANVGYKYGSDEFRDTGTIGPEGGVKWYVKETTFIYGRIGYDVEFRRFSRIDDRARRGSFVYALGMGINF